MARQTRRWRAGSPRTHRAISSIRATRALSLCLAVVFAGCASLGPPEPLVSYQAEVDVEITRPDGTRERAHFFDFHREGKRRFQARAPASGVAAIDRPDLGVTWVLDLVGKSFEELALTDPAASVFDVLRPFDRRAVARFRRARRRDDETGEGGPVEWIVEGERVSGRAWLTAEQVPLRFEGRIGSDVGDHRVEIVYLNHEFHEPIPSLFAIPVTFEGYADRTQPRSREDTHNHEAVERLREEGRRRPPRPIY